MGASALVACRERSVAQSLITALRAAWPALHLLTPITPAALEQVFEVMNPSIVFLVCDECDGMAPWRRLDVPHPSALVVLSAHAPDAINAFDVGALDFVPMPWTVARLRRCVARVQAVLGDRAQIERVRWIAVSTGRTTRLLAMDDIVCLLADHKYTRVVTSNAEGLTRQSLNRLETSLDAGRFVRASRHAIVNLDFVLRIVRHDGRIRVELAHATGAIAVSRAYQSRWRWSR